MTDLTLKPDAYVDDSVWCESGMIFVGVNLYLQPMVLAGIIFLAVFFDAFRTDRLARLRRRAHTLVAARR